MKLLRLIAKNLKRRPLRTALTIGGVASAMALFVLVESLAHGLDRAMSGSKAARSLVVYRQNRYCPQTSSLPERYADRIREIDGVASVLPVKVYLNNCRASLDVVTFQGAPIDELFRARPIRMIDGDAERFRREHDAALVGRAFAQRKDLDVGDVFRFGNVAVKVAGVFGSSEPIEEGVILTHLEYLQRASGVDSLGFVTQFEVEVDDASRAPEIARAIDRAFESASEPTDTRSRILFLESATRDLREILAFARILGLACVVVVLALVANTILMSTQERVRELGVFRTLGFGEAHVAGLIVGEAVLLATAGAALGVAFAFAVVHGTSITLGAEGVPIGFALSAELALIGLLVAIAAGALAGLVPAVRSARAPIVASLRSV